MDRSAAPFLKPRPADRRTPDKMGRSLLETPLLQK